MNYELWEVVSGNRLGHYSSEREALAVVREIAAADGAESINDVFLDAYDALGHHRLIAEGAALAERAGIVQGRAAKA